MSLFYRRLGGFAAAGLTVLLSASGGSLTPSSHAVRTPGMVMADDIPVARTPTGGYGKTFPKPVLISCTEPLAAGAPDLRGIWKTLSAERHGAPVPPGDRIWNYVERIEQCGDRIVDMGGGTIADARADGTRRNGVHDVSVFDYKTPINVIATYELGVFVLRPLFIPVIQTTIPGIKVTRRLDARGDMLWTRPDLGRLQVTLRRVGAQTTPIPATRNARPCDQPVADHANLTWRA